jgi:intracellular multiplication protein IcmP
MAGAAQQPNQSDGSSSILWVVAGFFATAGVIWYIFKKQLIHYFFVLKLAEINLISYFTSNLNDVRTTILAADTSQLKLEDVMRIGDAVGSYLRYPCIFIIVVLAVVVYFSNSVRTFKRIYSMLDLLNLEKNNWPQVSTVSKLNLGKVDIDKGPWAMAMSPMQFCKHYQLLEEYKRQPNEGMSRKEWNRVEVNLKRGPANQIFATQLGALWSGTKRLPPHTRALFAVFAARINNDSEAAASMLRQLAASSTTKLNFNGVEKLLNKHENTKLVQKIVQSHAYVLTVMAAMLKGARDDGVQASADFLWLKPLDRRLWYMLNTVGRQTPFVEVGGPFAHWVAEREIGRKLLVPMIEEATNALGVTLKEIIYTRDEEEQPNNSR